MKIFISGGAKNGKSTLAQDLTIALSRNGPRYYLATMIPTGPEDLERIRRHVADRDGLGFQTVECCRNILSCLDHVQENGRFLVDSATALLQNAMFPEEEHYEMNLDSAYRCAEELVAFANRVENVVIVSDYIYSDADAYSDSTEAYRKCLATIDRKLAQICDTVVEVVAGQQIIYKGALPL